MVLFNTSVLNLILNSESLIAPGIPNSFGLGISLRSTLLTLSLPLNHQVHATDIVFQKHACPVDVNFNLRFIQPCNFSYFLV